VSFACGELVEPSNGLGGRVGRGENDEEVSLDSIDWPASEALRHCSGQAAGPPYSRREDVERHLEESSGI